ncbi:hypothetical protein M408DRAFT_333025 [Serendipita vermifera MAFF 305830]|uniref:NmrA-like domain-containing protein n=1 Tax=Serendipita vermifera MAFF 305830 TaxID=933852 RepID=A0A0C3AQ68_SERVB|nr:hypothetical protein M408DRAFT_333025 [Serendipita vermifera MAFF 305830]
MAFTKIAVLGAGGNLGKHLMQGLLASTSPKFEITALTRPSSSYTAPADNVKVVKHDLADHAGIVEHLRGIEAFIIAIGKGSDFVPVSKSMIDAAIDAGVKLVLPSDYGAKDTPIMVKASPLKPPVRDYVQAKAQEGKITYTLIKDGAIWEMPLKMAYGIDHQAKTATIYGDGTQRFNATSFGSIAQAVVGILRSPAQYANKTVSIHDFHINQQELLSIIESEVNPDGAKFETVTVDIEELGKKSVEGLERGEFTMQNIFGAMNCAVYGEERAADWDEDDDSVALGLEKKDLRAEIRKRLQLGY